MSFNPLGNREDMSLKLRTQNPKVLTKEQTKLLEMETEKMAERLMELKIAMSREKEEREKTFRGGGFWSSGQAGSLGSYPKEVLSKPTKPREQNSGKKITWLKNEPIVVPERTRGPCTMASIADRKLPSEKSSNLKFKGRRCGQCEEKAAHVSCTECGEDYCAGCFAAFHLKGALKKHRSTPIGCGGLRTPRSDVTRIPKDDYKENIQQIPGDRRTEKVMTAPVTDSDMRRARNKSTVSVQGQGSFTEGGGSLLEGTYDPIENQRQFEEALQEWRQGGKARENGETKPVQAKTLRAADVSVETATDGILRQPVDIKFSSSNLSYAERLMLKKHRRMELGAFPGTIFPSSSSTSGFSADETLTNEYAITDRHDRLQGKDGDDVSEAGRISRLSDGDSEGVSHREMLDGFLASSRSQLKNSSQTKDDLGKMSPANRKACSARLSSERQKVTPASTRIRPLESKLSIVELSKPLSKRDIVGLERSTTYHVIEIPDPVSERTKAKQPAFRRVSARPTVRKDAFSSPSGSVDLGIQPRPPRKPMVVTQTSVEAFDAPPKKVMNSSKDTSVSVKDSKSENPLSQSSLNTSMASLNSSEINSSAKPNSSSSKQKGGTDEAVLDDCGAGRVDDEKVVPSQTSSRVKKVPVSRAASKLGKHMMRQGELDEPTTTDEAANPTKLKVASRPRSQTTSRRSQRPKSQAGSRPVSRIASHRDGCLTKVASEDLRSVARMADISDTSQQQLDLGAYFTMAVNSDQRELMTPVSSRLNSARPIGRWKVSNTLYQMGPRSWKPDASLVETVSVDQAQLSVREGQRLISKATAEPSSPNQSSIVSWSLSHGLSSTNSSEKPSRMTDEEAVKPSGRISRTSNVDMSSIMKVTQSKVKSDPRTERKVFPKEDEALREMKLNFVQGHSVTPNMMIPGRFRRPGSGASGRESQCGSISGRESQLGSRTGRESLCASRTGRESQMIVYDGDELSNYDEQDYAEQQRENDAEVMKRLDSEIASETGLAATDAQGINSEYKFKENIDLSKSSNENVSKKFHRLRESQLMCDFEEMEAKIMEDYEEEVKALK